MASAAARYEDDDSPFLARWGDEADYVRLGLHAIEDYVDDVGEEASTETSVAEFSRTAIHKADRRRVMVPFMGPVVLKSDARSIVN